MLDVGWTEMLVIAIVLIVVVGPKDLPRMLRTFGRTTAKMRAMAGDFRKQFDEALKEAELEDVKSTIESARKLDPTSEIKRHLNPIEKVGQDVRAGLESAMKPDFGKQAEPAPTTPLAAEPLKGPVEMPTPVEIPAEQKPAAAVVEPAVSVGEKPAPDKKAAAKPTISAKAAAAKKPAGKASVAKPAAAKSAPARKSAAAGNKKTGSPA